MRLRCALVLLVRKSSENGYMDVRHFLSKYLNNLSLTDPILDLWSLSGKSRQYLRDVGMKWLNHHRNPLGPLLMGFVATRAGWRWIFWIFTIVSPPTI